MCMNIFYEVIGMSIDSRTAIINGRLMNITSETDLPRYSKIFGGNKSAYSNYALEVDCNGETYVLPFINKTDKCPGVYQDGCLCFVNPPETEAEKKTYGIENLDIIDIGNSESINEFLNKTKTIRDMEATTLSSSDDRFIPSMLPNDSPEMRAFKEAIALKNCDINKYAPRFGENFLNDKRLFKTGSITMNKLISISKNLDIEAELILRDTSDDVPNKMGREVRVILTGDSEDDNE